MILPKIYVTADILAWMIVRSRSYEAIKAADIDTHASDGIFVTPEMIKRLAAEQLLLEQMRPFIDDVTNMQPFALVVVPEKSDIEEISIKEVLEG